MWSLTEVRQYTDGMSVGDVFQHVVNGSFRCVALAVVAPAPGAAAGGQGGPTRRAATQRLIAFRIGTCENAPFIII